MRQKGLKLLKITGLLRSFVSSNLLIVVLVISNSRARLSIDENENILLFIVSIVSKSIEIRLE